MDDIAHLPEAVGQMALLELGPDTLRAVRVTVDPVERTALLEVVPRSLSYDERMRIMTAVAELQRVFDEDVAIMPAIVDEIDDATPTPARQLTFAA
ncbi:hypothetical protein [Microbacterium album]|uniref:Uncharacterized protein n=1 Tax=Microbacterium album TaxID=2053191 RepID=A0A917IDG6_9MICO|nr:hypothetical protein [Microbacterium album]GGH36447.1 hypothetical protein GCM10010921_05610 [Microbacterium album]